MKNCMTSHIRSPKSLNAYQLTSDHSIFLGDEPFKTSFYCFCCEQLIKQFSMDSFALKHTLQSLQNNPSNPQVSNISKQRIPSFRNQQMSEGSNEIQTPNFHFFHNQLAHQATFDAYHNQFSQRTSQINKLISTFEDLGLDVEYIEDSDLENDLHSIAETLNQQDQLKRTCSLQEKNSEKKNQETTVSSHRKDSFVAKIQQKVKFVKDSCLLLRNELLSIRLYQQRLRAQSKSMWQNASGAFFKKMNECMTLYRSQLQRQSLNSASNIYLQNLRRNNDQLETLFTFKQYKIKKLIKQNEFLTNQNQKLEYQLSKISKKHQKCKEINGDYESMLKMQSQNEKRMDELQLQNNQLTERIQCLQWNLKQAYRNLAYTTHESKDLKQELQRKYQKIFEQTVQILTKKIQVQTYYKMKHQYVFNLEKSESKYEDFRKSDDHQILSVKQGSLNRSKSSYDTTLEAKYRDNRNFVTFRPPILAESLPTRMIYSSQVNRASNFEGYDSCSYDSSKYSEKTIESHERQAQRILNDINMMKKNKIQTSLASSTKLDYRRQSFGRNKYPNI